MSVWTRPRDLLERLDQLERRNSIGDSISAYDPDERPGPVQGVDLDFRVREKRKDIRYNAVVKWDPMAPGTCQADVLMFIIQLEPTNENGVPKEAGRRLWASYVVKSDDDLEADNLRVLFRNVSHPRKWYYRARVRAVDMDGRRGEWSDWTAPLSPQQDSKPSPPFPSDVALLFDKNEKDRHEPRWRAKVRFSEIEAWDVPPTNERSKATGSLSGAITAGNPPNGGSLNIGSTTGWAPPNPGERIGGVIRPHGENREIFEYSGKTATHLTGIRRGLEGTNKRDHPDGANVVSPASEQMEAENDLEKYVVQIRRCDSLGNFLRDGEGKFIQRTKSHSWHAEEDDADGKVLAIFSNVRWRHYWKARARTVDRFNRKGDWSDWSNLGSPSDSTPPPQPNNVTVEVDNHKVHVDWDFPGDTDDPDVQHVDIAYYQVELHRNATFTNLVKKDFYQHGTKKTFRVKKASIQYWARVRSVDASGNKSAWMTSNANKNRPPQLDHTGINIDFIVSEREQGARLNAEVSFVYDEVGYNEDHIDRYVVQLLITDGPGYNGNERRRRKVLDNTGDELESDLNDPKSVIFKGVRRRHWVRARVRAIDKDSRKSPWSLWSSSFQVGDTNAPPAPVGVTIESDVKGVWVDWDAPDETYTDHLGGLVFDNDTGHTDIDHYQVELHTNASFTNRIRKDRHHKSTKRRFKGAGINEFNTYYARVRSVSSSGTKSGWVTSTGVFTQPIVDNPAIVNNSVDSTKLQDGAATNPKIGNGAVTGPKTSIPVVGPDITNDLGNIVAGNITGATITGGIFQTATSGVRIRISSADTNRIDWTDGSFIYAWLQRINGILELFNSVGGRSNKLTFNAAGAIMDVGGNGMLEVTGGQLIHGQNGAPIKWANTDHTAANPGLGGQTGEALPTRASLYLKAVSPQGTTLYIPAFTA